jgi:pyridoxal phosphate enzyme (YggS family)
MNALRDRIRRNLEAVREGIARASDRSGRDPAGVTVVGASKTVSLETVRLAVEGGLTDLGENYVNELRRKAPALPEVRWHFIGTLQSNTARHVAELVEVVETLSGAHAARRLSRRATASGRTVDGLIEVDMVGGRSGIDPPGLGRFAEEVAGLEGIRLIGLMTLPPLPRTPEDSRQFFVRLRELRDGLRETHPEVLELSMGMSLDYEVAVEEGATMVRIGTAVFGPRTPPA